jgi:hypothetical protein
LDRFDPLPNLSTQNPWTDLSQMNGRWSFPVTTRSQEILSGSPRAECPFAEMMNGSPECSLFTDGWLTF